MRIKLLLNYSWLSFVANKARIGRGKGFTLVEISMVIVLIGLVVAAIMGGRDLMEQAKLRKAVSDIDKYVVAANTFQLEYGYYPGDMPNASAYGWGAGLNGNGNKAIEWGTSPSSGCNNTSEHQKAWVMMSQANLIDGSYSYTNMNPQVGIHVPEALGGQASFAIADVTGLGWNYNPRRIVKKPAIFISNVRPNGWYRSCTTHGSGLTALQASNIDKKIDDGQSFQGSVRAMRARYPAQSTNSACHDGTNYDVTSSPDEITCAIAKMF